MPSKNKKVFRATKLQKQLASVAIIMAAAIGGYILFHGGSTPSASNTAPVTKNASNTITSKSALSKIKNTAPRDTSLSNTGSVVDNKGSAVASTPSSEWTVSSTGMITLYSPIANSNLTTGDTISGAAKVDRVYYRLVDNSAGVLAQGGLDVVNGKFSGRISFSHTSDSGSLELYSISSIGGPQQNNLKINVSF